MKKGFLALIAIIVLIFVATPPVLSAVSQMNNKNGRWENTVRGNPYGDSRINRQADPRFNPMANPGLNRGVDPRFNPKANPTINRKADPRFNPAGDPQLMRKP